jgi:hypothetical protein
MRTILVVVVIAGVACLEPAPQTPVSTPVSTGTVEHKTPPAVGRLEVVKAQGTNRLSDLEQTFGPVIASGIEAGRPWSLRGRIDARGASIFWQTSTGGGGGGGGALPFADLGCPERNLPDNVHDRPDLAGKTMTELFKIFCEMADIAHMGTFFNSTT